MEAGVVVFDGAMGTSLQAAGLGPDDFGGPDLEGCNEILGLSRPDVVRAVHDSFLAVGVDVIETNTFGAFAVPLGEYGLEGRVREINLANARIAREAADHWSATGRRRFVAGSVGPGTRFPSLGQIRFEELAPLYAEQVAALLDGGVDLVLIETVFDLLQLKAAVAGARRAMVDAGIRVPIQTQVTIELTGRMLPGTEIAAALTSIEALRPQVVGLNCATGPEEMSEHLRHLVQHARVPVACIPNAGLPSVVDGHMHYDLTPDELAAHHARFVGEFGVRVVGGCCGTTPEHLKATVDAVRSLQPAPRRPRHEPAVASIYSQVTLDQDTATLFIGERTNANGSRKFREALLAEDWDTCVQMARDQIAEGAHVIDLCVDYVGRDGVADMDALARRLATQSSVPIVLDSTEPEVLEAGLRWLGGRAILNSANLEEGEEAGKRMDRVFRLAREYGAAVICLLIDEEGQARDVEWKMRVAHRLYDIATRRYGLEPGDLLFDALTFPLTTGDDDLRRDAIATIEAIRRIKSELPGVYTTLGVSNVSFGLKPAARHVLNSVFLAECVKAGLDSAIVHAGKIRPLARIPDEQRRVCEDLIWDRRGTAGGDGTDPTYDPLTHLLEVFADVETVATVREDRSDWTVERRLETRIVEGDRDGLTDDLDEALAAGLAPLTIINEVLLAGMRTVGELFASGEMQLPFVLQSAETMKAAVAHLEPHMERVEDAGGKGSIVLATVRGDVHDIGKNLVDIILTNNGFTVHNLGIKVSIGEMIDTALTKEADAIGMSGLLVKSTLIMRDNLVELNERGLSHLPVLLGGAALTRSYVENDLREVYEGPLFYGKDAFEGLHVMERLAELKRSGEVDPDFGRTPTGRRLPRRSTRDIGDDELPSRSPEVVTDNPIFEPPFLGSRVVKGLSLDEIAEYVNETALYRNQWQFRPEKGEDDAAFKERLRVLFRDQLARAKAEDWLVPQVVYGYWPVNGDGDDLVVWADPDRSAELARFHYPRQRTEPWLCIADFFRPVDGDEVDYAAFHLVTMGPRVSEVTARLFAEDRYREYLLVHGLGTEMTEALAEMWHRRIREEWGFADEDGPTLQGLFRQQYRGGRYSWGYPACPDLEDNRTVADLLGADRLGIVCDEDTGFQYQPEQTTSALICHHPRAKYFVAR
ncbi:MAG: methionine synthase [Actinomyces sp.]|nr:MAG: methionine synthase [Actinomyces sp.]